MAAAATAEPRVPSTLRVIPNLQTYGNSSSGIVAQSIGGGGGNGGFSVGADLSGTNAFALSFGGAGGTGNTASSVSVTSGDANTPLDVYTVGDNADGILAQSIGGGGGNGGASIAGVISAGSAFSFGQALGSGGGSGSTAAGVTVASNSIVWTQGENSSGIVAQSIGGGGGNAGFTAKGILSQSGVAGSFSFGSGGSGGDSSTVDVTSTNTIVTVGDNSNGILAQSVGGGGGYGGVSLTNTLLSAAASEVDLTYGSACASGASCGGNADDVNVTNSGSIQTSGANSSAMLAQSIGGGGGDGGFAIAGGISAGWGVKSALGRNGGNGGNAGNVDVQNTAAELITSGSEADGVLAQSIGGGGGAGGFAVSGNVAGGWGVNLALGGSGGSGGSANTVTVNSSSEILTSGDLSDGISAQSIGGGGGTGGFAIAAQGSLGIGGNVGIGGGGGSGNAGNDVGVTNTGLIVTAGTASNGILAQSIGGGGGDAGFVIAAALSQTNAATFGFGASGAGGSDAGTVTVANDASIGTSASNAQGIEAQSIGGGGGNGAMTFASGMSGAGAIGLSFGGSAGAGGNGQAVTVNNGMNVANTTIQTTGLEANDILAQSIGGGGGNGGVAIAANSSNGAGLGLSVGGDGGTGGNAGVVQVNNNALLATTGNFSNAIMAQSVGGGGGNGAFDVAGGGSTAFAGTVGIGGSGGDAGNAAEVDVVNNNQITTVGDSAAGIIAQSIGGGGGSGGFSIAGTLAQSGSFAVAVGGSGGGGGNGGAVNVQAGGTIGTNGANSDAVIAQSIGGGGGNGGFMISNSIAGANSVALTMGANGGVGGNADAVSVTTNSGASPSIIVTSGYESAGVLAQSIGGGGGNTGFSVTGGVGTNGGASLNLGAQGGAGGSAGAITVNNAGIISTTGELANAISAQSIGGGGGNLGTSASALAPGVTIGAVLGGSGGGAGDGSTITLNNSGAVFTTGDLSNGIFAQSIGGGGGYIGSQLQGITGSNVQLGATTGTGGNGGDINLTNSGAVATLGTNANAIDLQSIGGGGGAYVGTGALAVVLGGNGGSGNGGDISLTNTGTINTSGNGAFGVLAQSIGGGGGQATNSTGTISLQGGNAGNGGNITIANTGDIVTTGNYADALVVQSIGGGGGLVNNNYVGSAGGNGSSGNINVTENGTIATTGSNSSGIVAQSAAGTGTSGNVNINVNGSIYVASSSANAVVAQSTGAAGEGNSTIALSQNGVIVGGGNTGAAPGASDATGAAVLFVGGSNNTLNNNGVITSLSGINGYAVVAQNAGVTTVNNNNVMVGSLDLDGYGNVNNAPGAVMILGPTANLGAPGTFTNSGILSIGGVGVVGTTNLTGSFVQSSTGVMPVDVDFGNYTYDKLNVSGNVTMAGTINLSLLNTNMVKQGTFNFNIVNAGGTNNSSAVQLVAPVSFVSQYQLMPGPGGALVLQNVVNFSPPTLSGDTGAFGQYIAAIQANGSSSALSGMLVQIFNSPNESSLNSLYRQLTPASYTPMEAATLLGGLGFAQQLVSCKTPGADFGDVKAGDCTWGGINSTNLAEIETPSSVAFQEQTQGISHSDSRLRLPTAAPRSVRVSAYGGDNLYSSNSSMWGSRFMFGLTAKRESTNDFVFSTDLAAGSATYQTHRYIVFPSSSVQTSSGATGFGSFSTPSASTQGGNNVSFITGGFRIDKTLDFNRFELKPYLGVNETSVSVGTNTETGAGPLDLVGSARRDMYFTVVPGIEFGGNYTWRDMNIRPNLDISANEFLGNDAAGFTAGLAGAASNLNLPFNSAIDRSLLNVGPSLDIEGKKGLGLRLSGNMMIGSHTHGGTMQLNLTQKIGNPGPPSH